MAEITEGVQKKVQQLARKYGAGNYDNEQDCLQEALVKILEMPEGNTESYYVQAGMYAMSHFMKRERAFNSRTTIKDGRDMKDFIHVAPWMAGSGDVDTMDRGRKTPTAHELNKIKDREDEGEDYCE